MNKLIINIKKETEEDKNSNILTKNEKVLHKQMELQIKNYKKMEIFPYELYTLMCGFAKNKKIQYNLEKHFKLLNIIN